MHITSKLMIGAIAATLLASAPASAAPILDLYNTGVDANHQVLANGATELHYTLAGNTVRVATSANGFPVPPWVGDDTVSAWAGPSGATDLSGPVGGYIYTTTFSLAGFNASTASITGLWAADDTGVNIYLNGVAINPASVSYTQFGSFTINSGFLAGTNTLAFALNNTGGPTGLRTELTGTATAVPEASTWAMMLLGFGMIGFAARRRSAVKTTVRFA